MQLKPCRLLCLDQRVLIYNSKNENSGKETRKVLSKVLRLVTDLILAKNSTKFKKKSHWSCQKQICLPFPNLPITLATILLE